MRSSDKILLIVIAFLAAWWFLQRKSAADQFAGRIFEDLGEQELATFLI